MNSAIGFRPVDHEREFAAAHLRRCQLFRHPLGEVALDQSRAVEQDAEEPAPGLVVRQPLAMPIRQEADKARKEAVIKKALVN